MKRLAFIVLLIVFSAFYFTYQSSSEALAKFFDEAKTPEQSQMLAQIQQLDRYQFDKQGLLSGRIQAEAAYQKSQTPDRLDFVKPTFYVQKNDRVWQGQSDTGFIQLSNQQTTLSGNVLFFPESRSATIETESLLIDRNKAEAYNNLPIRLISSESQTQAVGVRIDFNQQTIKLLSHVQSIYQTPNHQP